MALNTRETILAAARAVAQAHGYGGLSFRELAKEVGIKSASIHYYFPTKGDLGAALARRYTEDAKALMVGISKEHRDPVTCLRKYTEIFRKALKSENRMCMCGFMAAEYDDLPEAVRVEVQAFADTNVAWLTKILSSIPAGRHRGKADRWALAIYAAIGGAQLMARSRNDISVFDQIVEAYRLVGLIPC